MQALKAGLITTSSFLLLGLITAFALNSCSSTFSELINKAFNIPQKVTIKQGVYHIQVPIQDKGYVLEVMSDNFSLICNNPDDPYLFNRADGGEQCKDKTCRFFFNKTVPESIEYLTENSEGKCSQINQLTINSNKIEKRYEVRLLVPKAVSSLSKDSLILSKTVNSQFNNFSQLSIGRRSRVDLEYTSEVIQDQLLINDTLFKIRINPHLLSPEKSLK